MSRRRSIAAWDPEAAVAETKERVALVAQLFARFPNTRLATPEATLAAYVEDTLVLTLEELRSAIHGAARAAESGFVPTPAQILRAHVDAYCPDGHAYNPHVTAEERDLTTRQRVHRGLDRRRAALHRIEAGPAALIDELVPSLDMDRALGQGDGD